MRTALADFNASLKRIRHLADRIVSETGAALADSKILELHETQQCGAVVLTTGYLETFLKDVVQSFVAGLSKSGVSFPTLPASMQDRHFEGGGEFLRKASIAGRTGRPTNFGTAAREDVAARLHSVASGGAFDLVWEAFADTESNPGPSVVKKIAGGLGLDSNKFWQDVSARCASPTTWSATAIETSLKTLIEKRNAVAHTGRVSPVPTAPDIINYVDMLGALGEGMVATLEAHLTALCPPPLAPPAPASALPGRASSSSAPDA